MFISLGHTRCHPAHAHTHTPVSSMDTGFRASGWPALTVTQKRTCEILISVKPQATIFASINTFSLVPSPEWQGRVKIFHSLKRAFRVYSSRLGRASHGFPVTGWTTRGASTLGTGVLRTQGSEPHRCLPRGRLQASTFRCSGRACVLDRGGRPLAWTLAEALGPEVQNPRRCRRDLGVASRCPAPGFDSSPGHGLCQPQAFP